MSANQTDSTLWEAFCQHDRHAFSELFKRFYPLLYKYGIKVTPNVGLLEDCIQELFIELWQQQKQSPVQSVKAYLVRALKYKLLRGLKKSEKTILNDNPDDLQFEMSYDSFLIAQQEDQQQLKKLVTALQELSPRQREIIYLKYFQGLNYDEVGHIMNLNYQVARNLLYQALKSLKKIISGSLLLMIL